MVDAGHSHDCENADPGSLCECACLGAYHAVKKNNGKAAFKLSTANAKLAANKRIEKHKAGVVVKSNPLKGKDAFNAPPVGKDNVAEKIDAGELGAHTNESPAALKTKVIGGITSYQSSDYITINEALRGAGGNPTKLEKARREKVYEMSGDVGDVVDGLDIAFAGSKLPEPVQVSRGVQTWAMFGGAFLADGDNTGLEWVDHGYTSTSTNTTIADSFKGWSPLPESLLMNITVPAGASAIRIDEWEEELLLNRGSTFRVTSDNGKNASGVRMIDVEVVKWQ